jgi:hypothetical protein
LQAAALELDAIKDFNRVRFRRFKTKNDPAGKNRRPMMLNCTANFPEEYLIKRGRCVSGGLVWVNEVGRNFTCNKINSIRSATATG